MLALPLSQEIIPMMPLMLFLGVSLGQIWALKTSSLLGERLSKPFLMPLLGLSYLEKAPDADWLILVALGLGWLGDIALLFRGVNALQLGLGFFLAGHVFYSIWFMLHLNATIWPGIWFALIPYVGYGMWVYRRLRPELTGERSALRRPVLLYLSVILTMSFLSLYWASGQGFLTGGCWFSALGSWLFVASDTLIANKEFGKSAKSEGGKNEVWIMITYILAQSFLILGLVLGSW